MSGGLFRLSIGLSEGSMGWSRLRILNPQGGSVKYSRGGGGEIKDGGYR